MKTVRFPNRYFSIPNAVLYLGTFGILIFTGIMFLKIVPYMDFGYSTNFLGTKTNSVLNKMHFRTAFYIHITSSLLVMGGGIFQFFPRILRHYPRFHRNFGKFYLGSILLLAAPSGLVLAAYANGGLAAKVGFSIQCFVWWFTTYFAFIEIKRGNVPKHIDMMLRSYAVTLAAMSLRLESYVMYYAFETKPIETYLTVTWLSWVGNLLIIELLIYWGLGRKLFLGFSTKSSNEMQ
jgi:Predicted membrane protein (DUF2306)